MYSLLQITGQMKVLGLEALKCVFNRDSCQHTEAVTRLTVPKCFKMERVENFQAEIWQKLFLN